MSGALLHGMGDCTPGLNCGCMSHDPEATHEALARVLSGYNFGTWQNVAEAIIADPAPLLAALAEAGVLTEEWAVQLILKDGTGGQVLTGWDGRKYTRDRALADAASTHQWCRLVRRYVSDWTEASP